MKGGDEGISFERDRFAFFFFSRTYFASFVLGNFVLSMFLALFAFAIGTAGLWDVDLEERKKWLDLGSQNWFRMKFELGRS